MSNWLQAVGLRRRPARLLDTRRGGAARRRLQLPAADDLPAVRGARPARPGAARGVARTSAPAAGRRSRQVTLPLAMPGIVAGLLLVFIPLTGDYITAAVLGGAKGNMVGPAGRRASSRRRRTGRLGSAMAMVLIFVILLTIAGRRGRSGSWLRAVIRNARAINLAPAAASRMSACRSSASGASQAHPTSCRSASASGPCSSTSSCSCRSASSSPTRSTAGRRLLVWDGFSTKWYHDPVPERAAAAGDHELAEGRGRQHAHRGRPRRACRHRARAARGKWATASWRSCSSSWSRPRSSTRSAT